MTIGLELTTAPTEVGPGDNPFPTLTKKHCCFLWIGKTTVCRIFSCQRSFEGLRPSNSPTRSLAGTPYAPLRSRGRLAFAQRLAPRARLELPDSLTRVALRRAAPFARGASLSLGAWRRRDRPQTLQPVRRRRALAALLAPADSLRESLAGSPAAAARDRERLAEAGGEYRDRTGDLLVANQALSQLS